MPWLLVLAAWPAQAQNAPAAATAPRNAAASPPSPASRPSALRPPPGHTRSLQAVRAPAAPRLDGRLDEAAWQAAATSGDFWISEQQRWPSEQTQVLLMVDDEFLYIGARLFDSQPQRIDAQQTRRDGPLGLDDQFIVQLDPFFNRREISSFSVNANGTQGDDVAQGRARKIEWKGDWQAAASRNADGWSVEMAIPLRMLPYDTANRMTGLNFARYHHRTGEWSRWADVTPRNLPEEMGHVVGIPWPATASTAAWTAMPYALSGRNVPDKRGRMRETLFTAGVDLRYRPSPRETGVVSVNPDFSQVERRIADINFSYYEKALPDPRPFFQEGSAYYGDSNSQAWFYSNRIPDFDLGAKYFVRRDRLTLGALATRSPDGDTDVVLRAVRELDATHSAGGMLVASDRPGARHALVAAQYGGRQPNGLNYRIDGAWLDQPGSGHAGAVRGSLGWKGDHVTLGSTFDHHDTAFMPPSGLLRGDRPGTRGLYTYATWAREYGSGPVRAADASVNLDLREALDGRLQSRNLTVGGSAELAQEIKLSLYRVTGPYRPLVGGPGQFAATANDDRYWTGSVDLFTRSTRMGVSLSHSDGQLGGGDYRYSYAYAWLRPVDRLLLSLTSEHLNSFGSYRQTVASGSWELTRDDLLALRWVTTDGARSTRVGYTRRVRKGMDVFALVDKQPREPTTVSVKVVLTFE